MNMTGKFSVGIRCSTYNQARYIVETMDGFVMQQTSFPFVAMIVDDASTDGQQSLICSYLRQNFDWEDSGAYDCDEKHAQVMFARHKVNKSCHFVVLFLKENLYQKGLHYKKLEYLAPWRNELKYEALCEGDDWWIDPLKLQKQFDFLETHPDHAMCTTSYSSYRMKDGHINKGIDHGPGTDITLRDLMRKNTIGTLTVMYRLEVLARYEKEVRPHIPSFQMGDIPLWLFIAHEGKIHELPCTTAMYRVLENSTSHSSDFNRQYRFFIEASRIRLWMNKFLGTHYSLLIWFRLIVDTRNFCRRWAKNNNERKIDVWRKAIAYLRSASFKF